MRRHSDTTSTVNSVTSDDFEALRPDEAEQVKRVILNRRGADERINPASVADELDLTTDQVVQFCEQAVKDGAMDRCYGVERDDDIDWYDRSDNIPDTVDGREVQTDNVQVRYVRAS